MIDISNVLFLGVEEDIQRAINEYGYERRIASCDHIIVPMSQDYYTIIYNDVYENGYNRENFENSFYGRTHFWIIKKMLDVSNYQNFYQFSKEDIETLNKELTDVSAIYSEIRCTCYVNDILCIEKFINIMSNRLGFTRFSSINDGCTCRVCGDWSPMALSDGLPDGKMNCWCCSTYRMHMCRRAMASIKR